MNIISKIYTSVSLFNYSKGGFRGVGVQLMRGACGVATPSPQKTFENLKDLHTILIILTHRRTLFRHGCDSYALLGENSSRRHFEGFHLTTSKAHLPEIGVRGPFFFC